MMICRNCKDESICKILGYINLYTKSEHRVATDNVFEAIEMYSKTSGESIVYSNTEYLEQPYRVIQIYKVFAHEMAEKRKREMESKKPK